MQCLKSFRHFHLGLLSTIVLRRGLLWCWLRSLLWRRGLLSLISTLRLVVALRLISTLRLISLTILLALRLSSVLSTILSAAVHRFLTVVILVSATRGLIVTIVLVSLSLLV